MTLKTCPQISNPKPSKTRRRAAARPALPDGRVRGVPAAANPARPSRATAMPVLSGRVVRNPEQPRPVPARPVALSPVPASPAPEDPRGRSRPRPRPPRLSPVPTSPVPTSRARQRPVPTRSPRPTSRRTLAPGAARRVAEVPVLVPALLPGRAVPGDPVATTPRSDDRPGPAARRRAASDPVVAPPSAAEAPTRPLTRRPNLPAAGAGVAAPRPPVASRPTPNPPTVTSSSATSSPLTTCPSVRSPRSARRS